MHGFIILVTFPQPSKPRITNVNGGSTGQIYREYHAGQWRSALISLLAQFTLPLLPSAPVPTLPSLGHSFSHARNPGGRHLLKSVDECNAVASQVHRLGLSNSLFLVALSRPRSRPRPPPPLVGILSLALYISPCCHRTLSRLFGDGAVNHQHHHHHRR